MLSFAGFITGMNAPNLTRAVIWGFVYSFEVMTQFMGRLARVPGQSGTCSFITFPDAVSMFSRNTSDSKEIASALHSKVELDNITFNTLHHDSTVDSEQPLGSVPSLKDLRVAVAGTKTFVVTGTNSLFQSLPRSLLSLMRTTAGAKNSCGWVQDAFCVVQSHHTQLIRAQNYTVDAISVDGTDIRDQNARKNLKPFKCLTNFAAGAKFVRKLLSMQILAVVIH